MKTVSSSPLGVPLWVKTQEARLLASPKLGAPELVGDSWVEEDKERRCPCQLNEFKHLLSDELC